MINCPDCDRQLHSDKCPCGWKAPPVARPYVEPPEPPKVYRLQSSSYRARWYAERGLPYEPPKLVDVPGWRLIGGSAPKK